MHTGSSRQSAVGNTTDRTTAGPGATSRLRRGALGLAAVLATIALVGAACGDDSADGGSDADPGDGTSAEPTTLRVPDDHGTIQEAVDAADPGDLILIAPGEYAEAVDVTTDELTIRGLDRNEVILDGGFELENGIRVTEADGVTVENMTARNYTVNGFFWTGVDGYRGSYLTAYRNGDYGIYAFDSVNGQFNDSYGGGSPDAGFYIGQCYPCNAVVDNVISENNGLGYSGTNAGGDLYIVNSTFRNNRAGIVPNSGSYELCYPERESTLVGNLVYDNNSADAPAIDVALLAQGNGILLPGGVRNTIERNRVWDHERTGIGLVPFPEEDASDLPPEASEWDTPCDEARQDVIDEIPDEDCVAIDGLLEGCVAWWNAYENSVTGNVVEGSGVADLAVSTVDIVGSGEDTEDLGNCFAGNTFATSAPEDLEALAPCGDDGDLVDGSGGDWTTGALDLLGLFGDPAEAPPEDAYRTTPEPGPQPNMPDAETAPASPATDVPGEIDVDAITVPDRPEGT